MVINEKMNESRVFVELITFIENSVDSGILLFKLAELAECHAKLQPRGGRHENCGAHAACITTRHEED